MIDANNQVHVGEVWRFSCGTKHMVELLKDPYFQHGLHICSLYNGPKGVFKFDDAWQWPEWQFNQVFGEEMDDATAVWLPSGSYKLENGFRSVVIGPVDSCDADIRTMIDTRGEELK